MTSNRYKRQVLVPEIGRQGQQRLNEAKVFVVGAGALGCAVLQTIATAGIGTIGFIDFDTVEESNLQRQSLYDTADIGKTKTEAAASRLKALNPEVKFSRYKAD
ncbi:MAG: ThiF family adenylyltransferase [Bacteroidota bacterium]|nr:ThiF family adenylyltransferase [Bacteroidota bacterium]